ncbi:uncharacterized protein zgc:194007 [Xyrauchen texanus]|uniref:uncharacterized protein zgc:194007 n=1 Tax=Xyrauchen texanus TaxID=154827 RepID=UPI0022426391|nr:uncharacterized protein zgc:194007 [Xyrauchen texanus]XP_051949938.1 uncharacterized protein zgc:194007 [Xyrauchen texanus]XP_051949939.1 uncharacterized protein zgc:194007 [Xyrauchen texanus]
MNMMTDKTDSNVKESERQSKDFTAHFSADIMEKIEGKTETETMPKTGNRISRDSLILYPEYSSFGYENENQRQDEQKYRAAWDERLSNENEFHRTTSVTSSDSGYASRKGTVSENYDQHNEDAALNKTSDTDTKKETI